MASIAKTLLVVDDEAELLEIIAESLILQGYEVLTAGNGREAFQIVETRSVDLIISDIRMRGGDGLELLARVRQRDASTPPVILMTAFADITSEAAQTQGAAALMGKPFLLADLKKILDKLLSAETP